MYHQIKKTSLKALVITFLCSLIIFSCHDEDAKVNPEESYKTTQYGKTIPQSINIENNQAKVSFMISAQFYTINLNQKANLAYVEILKSAINKQTPINIVLKENTNEIVKVEEISTLDQTQFKQMIQQGAKATQRLALSATIPGSYIK